MTIAILALLTLIEGVRRVPAGSVVLRRVLLGPWTVERPEPAERLRLLSWWSPIVTTIVLAPREAYHKTSVPQLRERLTVRELYTPLFDLRVLGALELVALVVGLPLAMQRWGAMGFLVALGVILLLCVAIFVRLRFSGMKWRRALPFLYPFGAPRAAEVLLEDAVRDVAPSIVTSALLPADAFLGWMRPFVYDASNGGEVERRFLEGLNLKELRESLAQRPASQNGQQSLWCPRCGATFIHGDSCSECGVRLVT